MNENKDPKHKINYLKKKHSLHPPQHHRKNFPYVRIEKAIQEKNPIIISM